MTDKHTLVERLRANAYNALDNVELHDEAATRITALEAREAELVEAAEALKQDLLERAEWDRSEAVKIVAAGNGVWSRFCATLAKHQEGDGNE